ncbi:MAG: H-type lectin domain-containing protein [Ignavibacterium sp.]|uniref:H-type lectin domain-containing protein n=1 Tax=Ignavibacterium sp. TaxID=2651167 RepID=UPI0040493791
MKNLFIITTIITLLSVVTLVAQVQSGTWSVKEGQAGYNLHTNQGERAMTISVKFTTPFENKPKVALSVTQIDADKNVNQRHNVEAISVSRDGFTIKIRTFADSKVFSISGYWIAHE